MRLHWLANWPGWILAFGLGLSIVCGYRPFVEAISIQMDFNKYVSYLYFTMKRVTWSVAIAWLVFACLTGNGGKKCVDSILINM